MKVDANQTTGSAASAVGQSVLNQGVHRSDGDRRSKIDSLSQDRLELSGLVCDIANAGAAGAARRGEHVKALAKLCRTGAYVPDPSALSRKLIDDALAGSETGNESF
jgi:hypothetical protein